MSTEHCNNPLHADYYADDSSHYTAEVIEVHGRNTPELSDEIAVQAGAKDLADLEEKIKESLKNQFESTQRSAQREEVTKQLLEGFDCELPKFLLEQETERQIHTVMAELGKTPVEGESVEEEVKEKAEVQAAKDLKTRIILRKVAKEEKVELNQYEVQMQLYSMAQHYNMSVEDLTKQLQSTNSLHEFTDHVLMDKTLDKIVDIASGKEA